MVIINQVNKNYTVFHLHSDYSLLDSCTKFEDYVDKAVELGQTAIASTEHGNIFNWVEKKLYCDKKGIKYIHGCEVYLTHRLFHKRKKITKSKKDKKNKQDIIIEETNIKIRDNYHTILLAKNMDGILELNTLVSNSFDEEHFYFKPRVSFDEFLNISDNIISTSACLLSPLNSIKKIINKNKIELSELNNELENNNIQDIEKEAIQFNIQQILLENEELKKYFEKIIKKYDYLEVQPHVNLKEQKEFNKEILLYSKKYNKKIIAGTDTHSLNQYKAECRTILQLAKHIEFLDEDTCDLTYKSYEELFSMFKQQNVLSDEEINIALSNTNELIDLVENFEIDKSFKYPILTTKEKDEEEFVNRCWKKLDEKIKLGIISKDKYNEYAERIKEELNVFKKVGMLGFMLSMSDFIGEARNDGIPFGAGRGSASGCLCAYLTDINDVDPIIWKTVFSRFCNEDRIEAGD